ncbi:MAG: acyl carrier protein [Clostridia bacterium]|nr:acyl carrier protein [Clostridia bacterium]
MIDRVKKILSEYTTVPKRKMTPESRLVGDLGMTSFDLVNAVVAFEDEFDIEISDDNIKNIQTIGDIIAELEKTL